MPVSEGRRPQLRDGTLGGCATLGSLLEEPSMRLSEETRLRIEAGIIGAILLLGLVSTLVNLLA